MDNVTFRDDENISKAFNEFFINIGPKLASEVRNPSTNKIETFLEDQAVTTPSFHFSNIPVENVLNTLRHLNVSKGTGLDKIPAKMLRIAADIIAPSLTYIFNLSISTGVFVDNWKDARVIPIYKEDERRTLGNYRPISILPIVIKVFEKEVFKQLYKHLNDNNLISKFQSGFRPGHSTIIAFIQMCDNWYENMNNGKLTGVVFIDIRKAFDSIDHAILLQKLAYYGVSQLEQQQCHVNGSLSTKREIICGVPQGSILGPLLFLIYINDLPNCLKKTAPCLYADDTQIFASSHDPAELANDINSTITAFIQMCDNWYENMDNGKLTGVVFIDIRKTFDSIDHAILLQKLAYYGVSQLEQQQCHVNGSLSTKREIICGVPQGSILGPLLFLIYMNDLPNCLKKTAPCLYADDTQIFASSHDPAELANDINSDLVNVMNCLNVNKLQSHSSKTKLMIIGSKQNLNNKAGDLNSSITMNNNLYHLLYRINVLEWILLRC